MADASSGAAGSLLQSVPPGGSALGTFGELGGTSRGCLRLSSQRQGQNADGGFYSGFQQSCCQRSVLRKTGLIPTGKREGLFLKGKNSPGNASRVSVEVMQ
ncbi:MAG: hypothetical protein ACXIT4_03480 [Erythrobacter sp.]